MGKHEFKQCPRCGATFECKANRVERCACLSIVLSEAAMEFLSEHYQDCLCVACLDEVNRRCTPREDAERTRA